MAAKGDPGVPYTYTHTYTLPGSVLAAKGDPGVPYTYIHTCIFPGSVLAAKGDPGVPYAYTHVHIYVNYQVWISFGSSASGLTVHACTKCTWTYILLSSVHVLAEKGCFSCMHACRYPSGSIRNGFVPIQKRSEQQLVKWSPLDQQLLRFVYNYQNKLESTRTCTRITFCRGGSLFAVKSDPAGSIIATKSDPAGSLFTRINFCVTVTLVSLQARHDINKIIDITD